MQSQPVLLSLASPLAFIFISRVKSGNSSFSVLNQNLNFSVWKPIGRSVERTPAVESACGASDGGIAVSLTEQKNPQLRKKNVKDCFLFGIKCHPFASIIECLISNDNFLLWRTLIYMHLNLIFLFLFFLPSFSLHFRPFNSIVAYNL